MGERDRAAGGADPAEVPRLRTWQLFSFLAIGTLAVTVATNRILMSEEVFGQLLPELETPRAQVLHLLDQARRLERIAYLVSPALLFVRVGIPALLVQLTLLIFGIQKPLAGVFRGAIWAQGATWLGSVAQVVWIATLPASALTQATLARSPGSIASLLPIPLEVGPALTMLLRQVTLFDLAWITLFATAIEDGNRVRAHTAVFAVTSTWIGMVAVRWGGLLYLTGLA